MTVEEINKRFAAIENELRELKRAMLRQAGVDIIPGFGPYGTFKDDPVFEEIVRLGREWREEEKRRDLEAMDREEEEAKKAEQASKGRKTKRKTRGSDART
jgi:hypothetical protein